jgi:hypothetical protein
VLVAALCIACGSREASARRSGARLPAAGKAKRATPRWCPDGTRQVGAEPPRGALLWCTLPDGRRHGPYRTWHTNGHVETEGQYLLGKQVGTWRFWSETGALEKTDDFGERVLIHVCAYDRVTGAAVVGVSVAVSGPQLRHIEIENTDAKGNATLIADAGEVSVSLVQSVYFQGTKRVNAATRVVRFDLEHAAVQQLLGASTGIHVGGPASCTR